MTISYVARLACLSLAAFFLLHLALAVVAAVVAPRALRKAERLRPRCGAPLLFGLRMLPCGLAALIVAGVCAPSYLWLEPASTPEELGGFCLAAAVLGVSVLALGMARGARAVFRSRRYLGQCERAVESDAPVLMLAGVFHSRMVISRGVRQALSPDQLAVAKRHERAHGVARDNLKRLLMLMAPDVVPFVRGSGAIERGWSRLAEWAADDRAVAGSRRRSLALAFALVRVARMCGAEQIAPSASSLLGDTNDLTARVDRLLRGGGDGESGRPGLWLAAALAAGCAIAIQPASLVAVHRALEALAH